MSCADSFLPLSASPAHIMYYPHSHTHSNVHHPHQMHPTSTSSSASPYAITEQWAAMVNGNHPMNSFGMPITAPNPFSMSSAASVNPLIHMQPGQQQVQPDQMLNENIMAAAVSYAVHNVPSTAASWSQIAASTGTQPSIQLSSNYSPPPQTQSPIDNGNQQGNNQQQPQQYKWMQVKRQITKTSAVKQRKPIQVEPSLVGNGTSNNPNRTNFTNHQLTELEKEFHTSKYLNKSRRTEIAQQLKLNETQVKI